jgi:hypothetical protein
MGRGWRSRRCFVGYSRYARHLSRDHVCNSPSTKSYSVRCAGSVAYHARPILWQLMLINQLRLCRACMPSITLPYLHHFLYLHVKLTASKQGAVIVVASC